MEIDVVAKKWRARNGFKGRKGGVVIVFDGKVTSWVSGLHSPKHWAPGCIAVDENGNQWLSAGGDELNGAQRWQRLPIPRTGS